MRNTERPAASPRRLTGRPAAPTRRRRVGALLALTVALAAALIGATAAPASAHAILERANPAGGTEVATAPARVTLGFSESVRPDSTSIRVIDTHGTRVDLGGAHGGTDSTEVTIGLKAGLPVGTYLVSWHVISADSHPVAGGFAFGIGELPTAAATAAAGDAPKIPAATAFVFGVARLVNFAGLALLVGAGFFLLALWPTGLARHCPRVLLVFSWSLSFVGALAALLLQGPYGDDLGLGALVRWAPLGSTLADRYGKFMLVHLLVLLLAVPLLRGLLAVGERAEAAQAGPADGGPVAGGPATGGPVVSAGVVRISVWTRVELAALAVAACVTTALIGHGGVGSWAWLSTTSTTVHLLAMSVWLGGLATMAVGLLARRGGRSRAASAAYESAWAEALDRRSGANRLDPAGSNGGGPNGSTRLGGAGLGGAELDDAELDDEELAAAHAYLEDHSADAVPLPASQAAELAGVLPRWSRAAMGAVAAIVASGVYQSWREVGSFGALFDTGYGRLLLYKLWFVLAMLGVGFLAHRWVVRHYRPVALAMTSDVEAARLAATGGASPRPGSHPADELDQLEELDELDELGRRRVTAGALAALRRGVLAEGAIGLIVLAVTAGLVTKAPGVSTYAPPFHTTTTAGPLNVDVRVSPTSAGLQTIDVVATDAQGRPQHLVQASVTLALPSAQVGPLDVPISPVGVGSLDAPDVQVPLAGTWTMTITLRISDFDEYVTTLTYRVH